MLPQIQGMRGQISGLRGQISGPRGPGGDWRMDGRTKVPLCSTGLRPLWGRCPATSHSDSQPCKAGQRVSLTTYCPWATCLWIWLLLLPKWSSDLNYSPCLPTQNWGSRGSGLVCFCNMLMDLDVIGGWLNGHRIGWTDGLTDRWTDRKTNRHLPKTSCKFTS